MSPPQFPLEISATEASQLVHADPAKARVLDVREPHELAICRVDGAAAIPMGRIPEQLNSLPRDQHLLVLCHHGSRSLRVTRYLRAQGFTAVSNITGGIDAWANDVDPTLARY